MSPPPAKCPTHGVPMTVLFSSVSCDVCTGRRPEGISVPSNLTGSTIRLSCDGESVLLLFHPDSSTTEIHAKIQDALDRLSVRVDAAPKYFVTP